MELFRGSTCLLPMMLLLFVSLWSGRAAATGVFEVRRKFPRHDGRSSGGDEHLTALREHDGRRHGRHLASVDLPLGGNGLPTKAGLYFTEIGIGTPAKSYYVDVDTGSDMLWVNGITCHSCPLKSDLGVPLTLYDPAGSASGSNVTCSQEFCVANNGGLTTSCPTSTSTSSPCLYSAWYGDGTASSGFFVTDLLHYNQVSGDGQTATANTNITFGCGEYLLGNFRSSSHALDGILGFGQSSSSMLSQLASAGKVRKIFAHCLDTVKGGGIFAIGNVVQPLVKTTPLVPNMPHYNVNLETIDVGGATLQLPPNIFDRGDGTIIDSGTTLAYLPDLVYNAILSKVFAQYADMPLQNVQGFSCLKYPGSVDDGFPVVTFHFKGDLPLNVYPHDYLFQNGKDLYCVGFQSGGLQNDGNEMVLLGDIAFSNKLVLYDIENQVIGWTDYNCSSSIKIKDDKTGSVYTVDAHDISSGWKFQWHKSLFWVLVTTMCSYLML